MFERLVQHPTNSSRDEQDEQKEFQEDRHVATLLAQSIERSVRARMKGSATWHVHSVSIDDVCAPALFTICLTPASSCAADFITLVWQQLDEQLVSSGNQLLIRTVAEVLADDRHLSNMIKSFSAVNVGSHGAGGSLCSFINVDSPSRGSSSSSSSSSKRHRYCLNIYLFESDSDVLQTAVGAAGSAATGAPRRKGLLKRLLARLSRRKHVKL